MELGAAGVMTYMPLGPGQDEPDAPERHASALSDALERIEALEAAIFAVMRTPDRLPHAERPGPSLYEQIKTEARPAPRVRAPRGPFNRATAYPKRIRCPLCRGKAYEVRSVGPFAICDSCVDKLEAALGVGG